MAQVTVADIAQYIWQEAPPPEGWERGPSGEMVRHGDPGIEVRAATVCWTPSLEVIRRTIELDAQLVISHEWVFIPYDPQPWMVEKPTDQKVFNIQRRELLDAHGVASIVVNHGSPSCYDIRPGIGNVDAFGIHFGFTKEIGRGPFSRVYEIGQTTLGDLARRFRQELALPGVRVAGDLGCPITRLGTAIGGLGQFWCTPEEMHDMGAEAIVYGEMVDYTIRHALELGMAAIELGHCATENIGMKSLAEFLQARFAEVRFEFLDSGSPWVFV